MAQEPDTDELAADLHRGIALIARRLMQQQGPGALSLPERAVLSRLDRGARLRRQSWPEPSRSLPRRWG
jgi:hypothetical protein